MEESDRKIHTLSEALSEKAEENIWLQEQNKMLIVEIKNLKSQNQKLKQKNKKLKRGQIVDLNSKKQSDEITSLKLELQQEKSKKTMHKNLVQKYETELDDIQFTMEKRLEKEAKKNTQYDNNSEIITLRVELKEVNKKLSCREIENNILTLRIEKEQQKKDNYKELLTSYKPKVSNNQIQQYGKEDIEAMKLQLHRLQQKYLSQKESLKAYETELVKTKANMQLNIELESKARMKYANQANKYKNIVLILNDEVDPLKDTFHMQF